jgi:hypothetical protein
VGGTCRRFRRLQKKTERPTTAITPIPPATPPAIAPAFDPDPDGLCVGCVEEEVVVAEVVTGLGASSGVSGEG